MTRVDIEKLIGYLYAINLTLNVPISLFLQFVVRLI